MWELRFSYKCNLYDDTSAGAVFISQVLFSKLPAEVKSEWMRITSKTYPALSVILKRTTEIIKQLLIVRKLEKHPAKKPQPTPRVRVENESGPHSSLKNFNTDVRGGMKKCEFCGSDRHESLQCSHYNS